MGRTLGRTVALTEGAAAGNLCGGPKRRLPWHEGRSYKRPVYGNASGPGMTFDYKAARLTMVESQVRTSDVTDLHVQDAMRIAPREHLCPPDKKAIAYADAEVEYAPGLYLLRPRNVGKMLQALRPQPGEKALAIAAPYAAMVMREIGLVVDEAAPGAVPAKRTYQVIVAEGSVTEVPAAWAEALADGGRMAVIVRKGPMGKVWVYSRGDGQVASREAFDAAAPFLPGFEPKAEFAF